MEKQYPYKIFNPDGILVMESPECCRYDKSTELAMLEVGYTIRHHGKRLTKTDIRKEERRANTRI